MPKTHPEVRALWEEPDQYVAALRYTDVELKRFFTGLLKDKLVRNTVVFLLGDHVRDERSGEPSSKNKAAMLPRRSSSGWRTRCEVRIGIATDRYRP